MDAGAIRWFPDDGGAPGPEWAHVSGWMQLAGLRRDVSCVLPCHNQQPALRAMLPLLTDALTESGFPWELIIVDVASTDGTSMLARRWSQLPGYRIALMPAGSTRAAAIVTGLRAARGDVVMVIDPTVRLSMSMVMQAITHWTDGSPIILSQRTEHGGLDLLEPSHGRAEAARPIIDTRDFRQADAQFVLLDRTIVDGLLNDG